MQPNATGHGGPVLCNGLTRDVAVRNSLSAVREWATVLPNRKIINMLNTLRNMLNTLRWTGNGKVLNQAPFYLRYSAMGLQIHKTWAQALCRRIAAKLYPRSKYFGNFRRNTAMPNSQSGKFQAIWGPNFHLYMHAKEFF